MIALCIGTSSCFQSELRAPATPPIWLLLAGFGVAMFFGDSFSIELEALRKIPPVFGVLMSLEPAVAALAGLVVLGERLENAPWRPSSS